jgi:hypothetical protein
MAVRPRLEMAAVAQRSVKSLDSLSSLEDLLPMRRGVMGLWVFAEEAYAALQVMVEAYGETQEPMAP